MGINDYESTPITQAWADWEIDLFEVGDLQSCLYSWFCIPCAQGQAKSYLDDSSWYVSCCMFNPIVARWLVRTAYGIHGSACGDCFTGFFCPCCSVNQMLQTTLVRRNPYPNEFGPKYNINIPIGVSEAVNTRDDRFSDCLYATCCTCCAVGTALESAIGMPWYFACLCVNPFAAYNILRYQYRLTGDECIWDCAAPVSYWIVVDTASSLLASLLQTKAYGMFFDIAYQIPNCIIAYYALLESKARKAENFKGSSANEPGKYLRSTRQESRDRDGLLSV